MQCGAGAIQVHVVNVGQDSHLETVSLRSLLTLPAHDEPQWEREGKQSSLNIHWHFGSRRDSTILLETSDILCMEFSPCTRTRAAPADVGLTSLCQDT